VFILILYISSCSGPNIDGEIPLETLSASLGGGGGVGPIARHNFHESWATWLCIYDHEQVKNIRHTSVTKNIERRNPKMRGAGVSYFMLRIVEPGRSVSSMLSRPSALENARGVLLVVGWIFRRPPGALVATTCFSVIGAYFGQHRCCYCRCCRRGY